MKPGLDRGRQFAAIALSMPTSEQGAVPQNDQTSRHRPSIACVCSHPLNERAQDQLTTSLHERAHDHTEVRTKSSQSIIFYIHVSTRMGTMCCYFMRSQPPTSPSPKVIDELEVPAASARRPAVALVLGAVLLVRVLLAVLRRGVGVLLRVVRLLPVNRIVPVVARWVAVTRDERVDLELARPQVLVHKLAREDLVVELAFEELVDRLEVTPASARRAAVALVLGAVLLVRVLLAVLRRRVGVLLRVVRLLTVDRVVPVVAGWVAVASKESGLNVKLAGLNTRRPVDGMRQCAGRPKTWVLTSRSRLAWPAPMVLPQGLRRAQRTSH